VKSCLAHLKHPTFSPTLRAGTTADGLSARWLIKFLTYPAIRWDCEGILMRVNYELYLVGGFNHLEKYESQWEGISHI
jgi:hypothetical protein